MLSARSGVLRHDLLSHRPDLHRWSLLSYHASLRGWGRHGQLLCRRPVLCQRHLHHHLPRRADVLEWELSANLPARPVYKLH